MTPQAYHQNQSLTEIQQKFELKPRLTLRSDKGEIIKKADGNEARYYLVPDTILSVKDGQKFQPGMFQQDSKRNF